MNIKLHTLIYYCILCKLLSNLAFTTTSARLQTLMLTFWFCEEVIPVTMAATKSKLLTHTQILVVIPAREVPTTGSRSLGLHTHICSVQNTTLIFQFLSQSVYHIQIWNWNVPLPPRLHHFWKINAIYTDVISQDPKNILKKSTTQHNAESVIHLWLLGMRLRFLKLTGKKYDI